LAKNTNSSPTFVISRGDSIFQIASHLKAEGLIRSKIRFLWPLFWSGDYKRIKAGKYLMEPDSSVSKITKLLIAGQTAPSTITIIPGTTINGIVRVLSRAGFKQTEDFLKLALPDFSASGTAKLGLEGYLYPDTYQITSDQKPEQIIKMLVDNFNRHFPEDLFQKQTGKVRSRQDVVIMASLLEKEVETFADKKIAAGILWKRLDNDLPLQLDSTLSYFLTPPKNFSYNTYKYSGLPFGPIGNPTAESLRAALEPTPTDYWYFLSAKDRKIIYSRTLGEHLINKAKYLE